MDTNWAAEHLQTIRTLMERSALYRRALAPIATVVGVVGILGGIAGRVLPIETAGPFAAYWMAVAAVAIAGSLWLVRKQAVKDGEDFWSPPLRRVTQAMFPPLLVGLVFGLLAVIRFWQFGAIIISALVILWSLFFGLALVAAGFFMPRGIRRFGWAYILSGFGLMILWLNPERHWNISPHWVMGLLFGAAHLVYGIYLFFTEPRKNET